MTLADKYQEASRAQRQAAGVTLEYKRHMGFEPRRHVLLQLQAQRAAAYREARQAYNGYLAERRAMDVRAMHLLPAFEYEMLMG